MRKEKLKKRWILWRRNSNRIGRATRALFHPHKAECSIWVNLIKWKFKDQKIKQLRTKFLRQSHTLLALLKEIKMIGVYILIVFKVQNITNFLSYGFPFIRKKQILWSAILKTSLIRIGCSKSTIDRWGPSTLEIMNSSTSLTQKITMWWAWMLRRKLSKLL